MYNFSEHLLENPPRFTSYVIINETYFGNALFCMRDGHSLWRQSILPWLCTTMRNFSQNTLEFILLSLFNLEMFFSNTIIIIIITIIIIMIIIIITIIIIIIRIIITIIIIRIIIIMIIII